MQNTDFKILIEALKNFPNVKTIYLEQRKLEDETFAINCNIIVSNNNVIKNINNNHNYIRQIIANLETFKSLLKTQKIRFNYSIITYKDYQTIMTEKDTEEYNEIINSENIYKKTLKK